MTQAHPLPGGPDMKRGKRRSLPIRALPLVVSSAFASAVVSAIHTLPATALLTRSAASAQSAALFALASHALLALTSLAFFSLVVSHDVSPFWDRALRGPSHRFLAEAVPAQVWSMEPLAVRPKRSPDA
jgi:hypothetical protein